MARGKQTCKILKEIRRQIAEANGIEFVTSECRYKGDCLGTCPKCEAEVRYLEQQLRSRQRMGKAVILAGISAASIALFSPMATEAQISQNSKDFMKGSIPCTTDTIKVRGVILSADTLPDGSIEKNPLIGATIENKRIGGGAVSDMDGNFGLSACIGDSLEISYIGYEPQNILVGKDTRNVTITLTPLSSPLTGETVVVGGVLGVKREMNHYLDLNVFDEYGKRIDRDDLDVTRIWIDEDGEEDYEYLSPEYFDDKHPCRIYWEYDYGLKDEDGKPLKEATLRIEAKGYDDPVIIKVKYPKRNAKKTIKFKHKKK